MMDSSTQTYDDPEPELGSGSPRVEIDTSAPFGSVEEAVIRFGGRGFWAPRPILHSSPSDDSGEFDVSKLEEQAADMLKDLDTKQQETLDILKELELTKRLIEELKLNLKKESSEFVSIPPSNIHGPANDRINLSDCSTFPPPSPAALVMLELKQAKLNLSQSTNDLEAIRASVECVNKKMDRKKNPPRSAQEMSLRQKLEQVRVNLQSGNEPGIFNGNGSPLGISRELRELNFEAEQFMRTAEAAKAEVLKAMCDIEQTKTGLKMIEMRWVAAKKLEEAAKAAEALALAEIRALSSNVPTSPRIFQQKPGRISLSFEEYSSLAERARKAESLFARGEVDDVSAQRSGARLSRADPGQKLNEMSLREFMSRVEVANRRFGAGPGTHQTNQPSFNNPPRFENTGSKPALRPSTSIGDILSRKLVLRDDLDVGRCEDRERVSLNQMLHRHRAQSPPPPRRNERNNVGNAGDSKGFFSKRKNLGFVHISLPVSRQSKNRIQALNLW